MMRLNVVACMLGVWRLLEQAQLPELYWYFLCFRLRRSHGS
jgi:hypothetical protein